MVGRVVDKEHDWLFRKVPTCKLDVSLKDHGTRTQRKRGSAVASCEPSRDGHQQRREPVAGRRENDLSAGPGLGVCGVFNEFLNDLLFEVTLKADPIGNESPI